MRILLSAAAMFALASCTLVLGPPSGQLALSNYRFDHAAVEAMVTAAPDCAASDPSVSPVTDFDVPFKGTHVIAAAPAADICWRRQVGPGKWTEWNRAFTASGRYIDVQP